LRQPEEVALEPGKVQPVAITLSVPADAAAFSSDRVTLSVQTERETGSSQVELSVAELFGLELDAPEEVVVDEEGFEVTVINQGNVAENVTVALMGAGQVIAEADLRLAPQERRTAQLDAFLSGFFTLSLSTERGEELSCGIRLITFGVPEPSDFSLQGSAQALLDTQGQWQGFLELGGDLSDYSSMQMRLDAQAWRASFAELQSGPWQARLGSGSNDPFRLGLPADFGLSGHYAWDEWQTAGAFGISADRALVGFLAGAYFREAGEVAAGLGMRDSSLVARARANWAFSNVQSGAVRFEEILLEGDLNYGDSGLSGSLQTRLRELPGQLSLGIRTSSLLTDDASLGLNAGLSTRSANVTVNGVIPLASEAERDFNFGVSTEMPSELPGTLSLNTQFGLKTSYGNLRYQADFPWGWRTRNQAGFLRDDNGTALEFRTSWALTNTPYLSLDGELTWYPDEDLLGLIGYRYQSATLAQHLTVFSSGSWEFGNEALGFGLGGLWQAEDWQVNLSADLGYAYSAPKPWTVTVGLSGSYLFDLTVPESITEVAGGRRLGVVTGQVRAADTPLADVEVHVGRYRMLTDEGGHYRAEVIPGDYEISVKLNSLPITYRLVSAESVTVEVVAKEVLEKDFLTIKVAALEGRVVQDSNADGAADEPLHGLAATLAVTDAEGLQRVVVSNEDGHFRVTGLLPGSVEVRLLTGPLGSKAVGDDVQTRTLVAGDIAQVQFLLQPVSARAKSFGGSSLRVRRITLEAERVPASAAPLVRVELQGEAEGVTLTSELGEVELSLENDIWLGRLPIPADASDGPLRFEIVASQEDTEARRKGQVIVSSEAPAFKIEVKGPVLAGEALPLSVTTFFAAQNVSVEHPFENALNLKTDSTRGTWTGELAVPESTPDDVYELRIVMVKEDGTSLEQVERFRVTEP